MIAQTDPLMQPSPGQPRLVWMTWEHRWKGALEGDDVYTLALLINTGMNTPEKKAAADGAVREMLSNSHYAKKSIRLLIRNGWEPEDDMIESLMKGSGGRIERRLPKRLQSA